MRTTSLAAVVMLATSILVTSNQVHEDVWAFTLCIDNQPPEEDSPPNCGDTGFCDVAPCQGPPGAPHETCSETGTPCSNFFANGNHQCSPFDPGFIADPDNDDTVNCFDDDDDGDRLTDEYEFKYQGYNERNKDTDGDSVLDSLDLCPSLSSGCRTTILASVYHLKTPDVCDVNTGADERADPYVQELTLDNAAGDLEMQPPAGWTEATAVPNREDGLVSDFKLNTKPTSTYKAVDGVTEMPDHVASYSPQSSTDIPTLSLGVGLMDRDILSPSNRIDVNTGTAFIAAFSYSISFDPTAQAPTFRVISEGAPDDGDGIDCSVRLGFDFVDNIRSLHAYTALCAQINQALTIGLGACGSAG